MKDEEEILDFDSDSSVETLSLDEEVSNKIDEMLDFFDEDIKKNKEENNKNLEELLDKVSDDKKEFINVDIEKLDEYTPSIRDFNIKSLKTKKIVGKVMIYTIIVMLFCFEFFLTKTGKILNNIKVYASDIKPIKITQNRKFGYIDYTGNVLVNPKYDFAGDYVNGYAIVKNSSNLPLIIDKGGKEAVKTGKYFSLNRASNNIIASKITNSGLKYGILNADLKVITEFMYDSIDFYDDIFLYKKENEVGLINNDGKIIYKYKLTDNVDKNIKINISKQTAENSKDIYAVLEINSSYKIVNVQTGFEVTKPTLNKIKPLENNVFKEETNNGNNYIYVKDDKVTFESSQYELLSIESDKVGILKALKSNSNYDLISTSTSKIIKENVKDTEFYYGDSVLVYVDYDFRKNKNTIHMIRDGAEYKQVLADFTVEKPFKNGACIIRYNDNTFGYMDTDGKIITDKHFIEVNSFDFFGEAIAKTNDGYGVINKSGKEIISFDNIDLKMVGENVKKNSASLTNNVFYAVKKDNRYALYNKNGKRYDNKYYNDVLFDNDYNIVKVSSDLYDMIIFPSTKKSINITSFNTEYKAYSDYIIIKNEYYNYKGKLIYVDKTIGDE